MRPHSRKRDVVQSSAVVGRGSRRSSDHPLSCSPSLVRRGFTLFELLVVVGIMLILAVLTIGAIDLSMTSERVRSAARQVQSLLEGASDRAIYAQEARGIRIQVNEQILEDVDHDGDPATAPLQIPTLATTIVYIGSPGEDTSETDVTDDDNDGDRAELFKYINVVDPLLFPRDPTLPPPSAGALNPNERLATRAIIGVNTRWSALYEQGLIGPGTVIRISPDGVEDARNSSEFLTIDPRSFPVRRESFWFDTTNTGIDFDDVPPNPRATNFLTPGGSGTDVPGEFADAGPPDRRNNEVLFLTFNSQQVDSHSTDAPKNTRGVHNARWAYVMETNPDVLPGEDPSFLPRNTCIDLHTSHLPDGWLTTVPDPNNPGSFIRQYSSRMDLLFSPSGSIVGAEGAAGLVHLHVCDIADAMANVPPGSLVDAAGEPRNGDEFGVTIFTRSGRVNVHPMLAVDLDLTDNTNPAVPQGRTYPPNGALPGGNGVGYWTGGQGYGAGDIVAPRIYNGLIYVVSAGGTAGGSAPRWNLNPGGLTQDNGVTWVGIKHDVWRFGIEGELAR